jgi:protein-S-isoprenylcysteine O-methyltransferase Ste14
VKLTKSAPWYDRDAAFAAYAECLAITGRGMGQMTRTASVAGYILMVGGLVGLILRRQAFSTSPIVIILQVCALALMLWARHTFGKRSFHVNASPTEGGLVTDGPYRWIRHPIYAAVCLFAWVCVAGHPSLFAVGMAVLVTSGSLVRIVAEEKLIEEQYPEYRAYARRTRRLIPYVF